MVTGNYRSQHAKHYPSTNRGKKKRLYMKRCFIYLKCPMAMKTTHVIKNTTAVCLTLKILLCPYLAYIVPEASNGKMFKQTVGG